MARISLVGLGHGGIQDYDTLIDWAAAESSIDYSGLPAEASCLGDCGGILTVPAFFGGIVPKIYTQATTWDFTNEDDLAFCDGLDGDNPVDVSDFLYDSSNQFLPVCNISSEDVIHTRVRVKQLANSSPPIRINGDYTNTSFSHFVATGGNDVVFSGYQQGAIFNNGIITGGSDKGVEASFGVGRQILTDCFAYDNVGVDFETGSLTINTCASEDGTGDFTGYTGTELVDPANKDWRTKSTSALATLGSGGSFIGVGLESGGGTPVSGDIYLDIPKPVFNITGEASLPSPSGSISFTVQKPVFSITGEATLPNPSGTVDIEIVKPVFSIDGAATLPSPTGTVDIEITKPVFNFAGEASFPFPQGSIDLTIEKPVFSFSGSSTQPNPSGTIDLQIEKPSFSFIGEASLPYPTGNVEFTIDKPAFNFSGDATLPNPTGNIDLEISKPVINFTGTATFPSPSGAIDISISKPEFVFYGTVSGITLPVVNVMTVEFGSNTIKLPYTSNIIKI